MKRSQYIKVFIAQEGDVCDTYFVEMTNMSDEEYREILSYNYGNGEDENVNDFMSELLNYNKGENSDKTIYGSQSKEVDIKQLETEINLSGDCPTILLYSWS